MTTFNSFEEMEVWQKGRKLVREIRAICKRKSVKHDFALIDQITRSSRSITANIAEGFEAMTNAEFIQFLGYAKRSSGEVRSHLYDALDENYISNEEFKHLASLTYSICMMLARLIHHLQRTNRRRRTHYKRTNNKSRITK